LARAAGRAGYLISLNYCDLAGRWQSWGDFYPYLGTRVLRALSLGHSPSGGRVHSATGRNSSLACWQSPLLVKLVEDLVISPKIIGDPVRGRHPLARHPWR